MHYFPFIIRLYKWYCSVFFNAFINSQNALASFRFKRCISVSTLTWRYGPDLILFTSVDVRTRAACSSLMTSPGSRLSTITEIVLRKRFPCSMGIISVTSAKTAMTLKSIAECSLVSVYLNHKSIVIIIGLYIQTIRCTIEKQSSISTILFGQDQLYLV